ncbi:endo-polygalacturonase PG1 [Hysterangium stoloniferum]|nr:endo-polygalacturonase PG1 [Hysterangium stoloniferum]
MVSLWYLATFLRLAPLLVAALHSPRNTHSKLAKRCTGVIRSFDDVSNAVKCTTINIYGFTTFTLALLDSTTVNLHGDIAFGNKTWGGPLFLISGTSIKFHGNGHTFDGGGPFHWDGLGTNGGVQKPTPMLKIVMSGSFMNTKVVNAPAQAFSISNNPSLLKISKVTIDNSQGDTPNSRSNGQPAAHNTDGFDVGSKDLVIQNCIVINQDDCIVINYGSNILLQNNRCINGHGISIACRSQDNVSGVVIRNNTIVDNEQALRIKSDPTSRDATVSNITFSGNTGTGLWRFGVLIDQSYPKILGTPGTGDVNFVGATNTMSVLSTARPVAVNCGKGACTGSWDWSSLKTSGGQGNYAVNTPAIEGLN